MHSPVSAHPPGAISLFFIYKAGVFAAGFWAWLAVLALTADHVSGWHVVAGTGAASTTLVGVVLGVRYAMARSAAFRHDEIMRTLAEISWYVFASAARTTAAPDGAPTSPSSETQPAPTGRRPVPQQGGGQDADVIQLAEEIRQRPRR